MAWAGKHAVNKGQIRYEAISEKLGAQALGLVEGLIGNGGLEGEDVERLTLLAAMLMVVQFKVGPNTIRENGGGLTSR